MKNNILIIALSGIFLFGCQEYSDYEPDKTAVSAISGEFEGYESCGGEPFGPYNIYIFNTSSNRPDSAWIENIYESEWQAKIAVNLETGQFSAENATLYSVEDGPVADTGLKIDIAGKFLNENDSVSFTFVVTDFSTDPPTVEADCSFSAHRATGFEEH